MGLQCVCVDYALPAATKLATGVQGSSLVVSMIANLFAANSKNLSCNKKHLWAGESYSPEVILPEQRFSQTLVLELTLNKKLESYGVTAVERPKIKATKKLDLSGDSGRQIILSETKLTLRTHQKTFKKLADM